MTKKKPSAKETAPEPVEQPVELETTVSEQAVNEASAGGEIVPIDEAAINEAVTAGRSVLERGHPKIDAAMLIYELLEHLPQETVVKAFIDGAGLTSKGALTYWYNCRRRLKRFRSGMTPRSGDNP